MRGRSDDCRRRLLKLGWYLCPQRLWRAAQWLGHRALWPPSLGVCGQSFGPVLGTQSPPCGGKRGPCGHWDWRRASLPGVDFSGPWWTDGGSRTSASIPPLFLYCVGLGANSRSQS